MNTAFNVQVVKNGFQVSIETKVADDEFDFSQYVFTKPAPIVKLFKKFLKEVNGDTTAAEGEVKAEAPTTTLKV